MIAVNSVWDFWGFEILSDFQIFSEILFKDFLEISKTF